MLRAIVDVLQRTCLRGRRNASSEKRVAWRLRPEPRESLETAPNQLQGSKYCRHRIHHHRNSICLCLGTGPSPPENARAHPGMTQLASSQVRIVTCYFGLGHRWACTGTTAWLCPGRRGGAGQQSARKAPGARAPESRAGPGPSGRSVTDNVAGILPAWESS